MQKSGPAGSEDHKRQANFFLDFLVVTGEAQLKVWEAFQVEGSSFVAKRMRANLELIRMLGKCNDAQELCDCQVGWLADLRKDYAEEWARCTATMFTLSVSGLAPCASPFNANRT